MANAGTCGIFKTGAWLLQSCLLQRCLNEVRCPAQMGLMSPTSVFEHRLNFYPRNRVFAQEYRSTYIAAGLVSRVIYNPVFSSQVQNSQQESLCEEHLYSGSFAFCKAAQ